MTGKKEELRGRDLEGIKRERGKREKGIWGQIKVRDRLKKEGKRRTRERVYKGR